VLHIKAVIQGRRRAGALPPFPFKRAKGAEAPSHDIITGNSHGLSRSTWNEFTAAICSLRNFRMFSM